MGYYVIDTLKLPNILARLKNVNIGICYPYALQCHGNLHVTALAIQYFKVQL